MDPTQGTQVSPKSRLVATLLCFFLGWCGAHRFYVKKYGTGVLMLCTLGLLGIWTIADLIMVICGVFTDAEGRKLFRWFEEGSV